ncbi:uncharacterized protein LOC118187691 [Stegodyphus dumicola]|uniref:uncharacterized protein LOC118187691 n=1 Tax=Stegodyphus dumicola TaxID=202533 RepID=UPI0015AFC00A|nr:uncharacterized protein LOC118187691 [Stegodyphus dumicola]
MNKIRNIHFHKGSTSEYFRGQFGVNFLHIGQKSISMDNVCSRAAPSRKRWGKEETSENTNSECKKSEELIEEITGKRFSLNKLFKKGKDKKGKDKRSSQSTSASVSEASEENVQKEEK